MDAAALGLLLCLATPLAWGLVLLALAGALVAGRETIADLGAQLSDLLGPWQAHLWGAGFVLARAGAILWAVARVKTRGLFGARPELRKASL